MLLADADSSTVLVATIITQAVLTIAGGYFALRANTAVKAAEDKAQDMEMRAELLESRVEQNEKDIRDCESDRKSLRAEGTALRLDNNQLRDYCSRIYRTMHDIVGDLRGIQAREIDRHPEVTDHVDLAKKIHDLPPPPSPPSV
jgi:chromosome segregation ATPase